jgi:hypothetical protein
MHKWYINRILIKFFKIVSAFASVVFMAMAITITITIADFNLASAHSFDKLVR